MCKWVFLMKSNVRLSLPERRSHSILETAIAHERLYQLIQPVMVGLRRFLTLTLIGLAIGHPGVVAAEGFLPDNREILMMPQLCQWRYGPQVGMDPALIPKGPPMDVSGCTRFHYYCDAHTDLVRAEKNAYTNPGKAKSQLERSIGTLKGQVPYRIAEPGCSKYLLADTYYTLGKALALYARLTKSSGYAAQAIGPLLQSIELTPEDARPYQVLGDVYVALNKRQQAEEAIYSGLQVNPESKPLLRRYREIGGKRPLPTRKPATPAEAGMAGGAEHLDAGKEPVKTQEALPPSAVDSPKPSQGNPVVEGAVQRVEDQADQDKSKTSRYCRFCADTDSKQSNAPAAAVQPEPPNPVAAPPACRFCP